MCIQDYINNTLELTELSGPHIACLAKAMYVNGERIKKYEEKL